MAGTRPNARPEAAPSIAISVLKGPPRTPSERSTSRVCCHQPMSLTLRATPDPSPMPFFSSLLGGTSKHLKGTSKNGEFGTDCGV